MKKSELTSPIQFKSTKQLTSKISNISPTSQQP